MINWAINSRNNLLDILFTFIINELIFIFQATPAFTKHTCIPNFWCWTKDMSKGRIYNPNPPSLHHYHHHLSNSEGSEQSRRFRQEHETACLTFLAQRSRFVLWRSTFQRGWRMSAVGGEGRSTMPRWKTGEGRLDDLVKWGMKLWRRYYRFRCSGRSLTGKPSVKLL